MEEEISELLAIIEELQTVSVETVEPKAVFAVDKPVDNDYSYLLAQYDWDFNVARAVMMAESRGNPTVINWNDYHRGCVGSYGLFQIACLHENNPDILLGAEYNVQKAYLLWRQSGWVIWGAFTDGSYLQYLE